MKKYFLFVLLFVTTLCMGFTSCSGDDDDPNPSGTQSGGTESGSAQSDITGSWKYNFSTGYQIMTFNSDGTGSLVEYDSADIGHEYYEHSFEYSYKNGKLIIYEDDEIEVVDVISLTNTKLVLEDSDGDRDTFTRISGDTESGSAQSGITGSWKSYFSTGYQITTFNSDGTGSTMEYDSADIGHEVFTYSFMYSYKNGKLTIVDEYGEAVVYNVISLTKSELVLEDSEGDTERCTRV